MVTEDRISAGALGALDVTPPRVIRADVVRGNDTCSASRWYVELSARTSSGNVAENNNV
jgi:hypothetical protein